MLQKNLEKETYKKGQKEDLLCSGRVNMRGNRLNVTPPLCVLLYILQVEMYLTFLLTQ